MASNISSISQALAGNAASIPIADPHSRDPVKMEESCVTQGKVNMGLPTPPNSLSPTTHPQGFRAKASRELADSPPSQIDSDIELEGPNTQALHGPDTTTADVHGNITPAYLAKHHLPDLVLEQGPIAIRHLMNQLGNVVPGFADIPPAKARRIVVGALESRRGGGPKGDVEFEKVGWGRWDARLKGQAPKETRGMYSIHEGNQSPPMTTDASTGRTRALRIPGNGRTHSKSRRMSHGSWTAESTMSTYSGRVDPDMAEYEADKMSIDGEEETRERYPTARIGFQKPYTEYYSDTDEEDWQSLGAAALRGNSYPSSHNEYASNRRSRSRSAFRIKPRSGHLDRRRSSNHRAKPEFTPLDFTGVDADSQEREAIEALLRMGSM